MLCESDVHDVWETAKAAGHGCVEVRGRLGVKARCVVDAGVRPCSLPVYVRSPVNVIVLVLVRGWLVNTVRVCFPPGDLDATVFV